MSFVSMEILFASTVSLIKVLCDFVEWNDLARLDSACCNRQLRHKLYVALGAKGVQFLRPFRAISGLNWLAKCNVHCLALDLEVLSAADAGVAAGWIGGHGSMICTIRLNCPHGVPPSVILAICASCTNLQKLCIDGAPVNASIAVVLQACKRLSHISMNVVAQVNEFMLPAVQALGHQIAYLHLHSAGTITDSVLSRRLVALHALGCSINEQLSFSEALRELSMMHVTANLLATLNESCPNLIYLASQYPQFTFSNLKAATILLKNLRVLLLGTRMTDVSVSDHVVQFLTNRAKQLQRLQHGGGIDIAVHVQDVQQSMLSADAAAGAEGTQPDAVSQLRELTVDSISGDTLAQVLQLCPALCTLRVKTMTTTALEAPTIDALAACRLRVVELGLGRCVRILEPLTNIQELTLRFVEKYAGKIDDVLLSFAVRNGTTLQKLTLEDYHYRVSNVPAIVALLPQLRELRIRPELNNSKPMLLRCSFVVQALLALHPRLKKVEAFL